MPQFYSYLWLREDGTPYYAGKGTGRRAFHQSHGVHRPADKSRILTFPMRNEAEAFESEIALIDLFGRKDKGTGCLRNLTDGGEGTSGHRHSEASRLKIGAAAIGNRYGVVNQGQKHPPISQTTREKMAAKKIGNHNGFGNPVLAAKQAGRMRGVPRSPEVMAALRTPEVRAKAGLTMRGRKQSPEHVTKRVISRFLQTVAWG